jgi:hypothetical protein
VSVFLSYRRSAGEERLQVKWFAWAAVLSLALLAALLPISITTRSGQVVWDAAVVAGIGLALPLAIGMAILRYRLYAIDKIISRTVSYALVTGLVAGVYLGCVALLTKVLPLHGSVAIAAAVLAAAALFNPLRRRVQAMVDRRFDRGPVRRRTRGRAVLRSAARTGRPGRVGRRPARHGESGPRPGAPDAVAERHAQLAYCAQRNIRPPRRGRASARP